MALIQVTPELLMGKATELRALKGQHDDIMARVTLLVMSLNEIWKGEAQRSFITKYEGMKPTLDKYSETLEGYAKLMETAANKMQETDTSLAGAMNEFG